MGGGGLVLDPSSWKSVRVALEVSCVPPIHPPARLGSVVMELNEGCGGSDLGLGKVQRCRPAPAASVAHLGCDGVVIGVEDRGSGALCMDAEEEERRAGEAEGDVEDEGGEEDGRLGAEEEGIPQLGTSDRQQRKLDSNRRQQARK
jgi:hypothetical protein